MPLEWEESDPRYIANAADVKLRAFMQQQLQAAAAAHGAALNSALGHLDPAVAGQLRQALGS